jgi:hypothetical protein
MERWNWRGAHPRKRTGAAGVQPSGAYDGIAVFTGLRRNDLALVASGVDFTRSLPNTSPHLFYVTGDTGMRMTAVRQSLRHLHAGGAVMIFASGLVDPDPALWPQQARLALHNWYGSVALFLRHVPQTRLVITITSHVLADSVMRSPCFKLVRQDWEKIVGGIFAADPATGFGRRFGPPPFPTVTLPELRAGCGSGHPRRLSAVWGTRRTT